MQKTLSQSQIEAFYHDNFVASQVRAYDPVATQEAARVMGSVAGLPIVGSAAAALQGADALAIVTEWSYATPRDRQLSTS